jgi:regulatory protein
VPTRPRPVRAAPAAPRGTARTAALALLGRRDYSTREVTDKLLQRGYTAVEVEAAVRGLAADSLLDDRRVAAAYVRTASQIKGRGPVRIAHELQARGIAPAIVDDVLGRLAPDDEADAVQRVLTRRHWPARPTIALRRKMFQHLLRRGFSPDIIAKAMRETSE